MKQVLKAVGLVLLLLTSCSKEESNPNNGNGNGNGNGNVTPPVEQKAIVITSYSKNYGYAGDSVDILGENFPKKEQCKVTFGNTEATITLVSADGKKLTLVLPRSSTYLPELKFYFGEKTVVDNKVTNDYEQKIGIIDKAVGEWVKTQCRYISQNESSTYIQVQVVKDRIYCNAMSYYREIFFSKDNGISWKKWASSGPFVSQSNFYITPSYEGLNLYTGLKKQETGVYKVPSEGIEGFTINPGELVFEIENKPYSKVFCDDTMKNIVFVAQDGSVYKSTNGKDFNMIKENNVFFPTAAHFQRDINHIWVGGGVYDKDVPYKKEIPYILFCNGNNGQWTEYIHKSASGRLVSYIISIDFPTNEVGYSILWLEEEYKILKSTNGGHNWQELSFVLRKTGSENTDISMAFQNENTGWVSLDKVIYKTTDGGNTWQKEFEAESNIKKLYYTQNVLYAFAENGLLYRYYFK